MPRPRPGLAWLDIPEHVKGRENERGFLYKRGMTRMRESRAARPNTEPPRGPAIAPPRGQPSGPLMTPGLVGHICIRILKRQAAQGTPDGAQVARAPRRAATLPRGQAQAATHAPRHREKSAAKMVVVFAVE